MTKLAETIGAALIGATITAVEIERYEPDDGLARATLKLADGRSYDLTSCSCCGGGDFSETPEKTQHELDRESVEGTDEWRRAQRTEIITAPDRTEITGGPRCQP